ncbi:unnamed protein product [Cuscuta europaea]|uniref:Uncharacterized protein n=1 Tax=Cuscuta europaea TaxID=41803 RepID=A0A9P1DZG1_CUSEU|nr:unnamed protein product [Cuscuta europaea]
MLAVQFPSQDSRPIIMSPRISFSHDVSPADMRDIAPAAEHQNIRQSSPPPLSSSEFNFCVLRERFDHFSSADELFLDGKILPTEIKRGMGQQRKVFPPPPPHPLPPQPLPPLQKQRWKLGRSSSLSCGTGTLCPLPLMSRSNSTGSSSPITKRNYQKVSSSSTKQSQNVSTGHHHQKPPLKKLMNYSGMGINPVLNIPPGSFFRLPSFFSGGKDKNRKK